MKIALRILVVILLLFLITVFVFSFESVQTRAASWLTNYLKESYDASLKIEKLHITYSGKVAIEDAVAYDHKNDTLISFNSLKTSIFSFGDLLNGETDLGPVYIDGAYFNMVRYKEDRRDNLSLFLKKFRKEKSSESQKPFELLSDKVVLTNARVNVIDQHIKYPESFVATQLNMTATQFNIIGSEVNAQIKSSNFDFFTGVMKEVDGLRKLPVTSFTADFSYSNRQIRARDLRLQTPKSSIAGDLMMNYDLIDFKDFVNKFQWDFKIDTAQLDSKEFKTFYLPLTDSAQVNLSGRMNGVLNNFTVNDMRMSTLDNTTIIGDVTFKNLVQDVDEFFIDGQFDTLNTSTSDLKRFLPELLETKIPDNIDELGVIATRGYASVNSNQVVAKLRGNSLKGDFRTDIIITDIQDAQPAYQGQVELGGLDLGVITGYENLGRATLTMDVKGRGFNPEDLNTKVNGGVIEIEYNGYTYRNIRVKGRLEKPLFNGHLEVNDPNLKMTFDGLANFSKDKSEYDFKADIAYADLFKTNLFTRDSTAILRGKVDIKMTASTLNDAVGTIEFKNASYKNDNDTYEFEDFKIVSSIEDQIHTITVNSPDIIEGEMKGVFNIEEIPELFKNAIGNVYTNYKSTTITKDQYLEYEFQIYDKIVDLVFPDLALGENTILKGEVASNEADFKLTFRTPIVSIGEDIQLKKVNVQINNQNPLFNTYIKVDRVENGTYDIDDFKLINVTRRDTLFFRTEFASRKRASDTFNLSFYHTVNESNNSVIGVRKSDITFQGKEWLLNKNNEQVRLEFDHQFEEFKLDQVAFSHKNEAINLGGSINGKTEKDLHLDFKNVRISSLTSPIDSLKMRGVVNGALDLKQTEGKYQPSSDFAISDFEINDTPLGDFLLKIIGNEDLTSYNVSAQLKDDSQKSFSAQGQINTTGAFSTIDVGVDLNNFNLQSLSPLGGIVLNDMRGQASGNILITGKLTEPDLDGSITLNNAGLNIPYLNTDFNIEQGTTVGVKTNLFDFGSIALTDTKYGTKGVLGGVIRHKNFGFWELGLTIDSDKLLVLDTPFTPKALYYGTAFIDGSASITGPTDQLFIDVKATTEEGTIFKVPLNDAETFADNSVIYFLSPEEKAARISGEEIEIDRINGLELRFDLNVTPVAEAEITVDQENGSYLTGSGAGNLLLEINTLGKFNMYGDFIVYDGIYNFKYAGIVNKEFKIQPGGSVAWQGDPTAAVIDVSASYLTQANPAILLDNPNINTQIPVEVITNLQGNLSFFDPDFVIKFPSANSVVSSELQYRLEDKSQRYLQAMSLISAGTFYNPNSILQNAGAGNLVEGLSSIVNELVGGNNGDIKFGVNYQASERNPNSDLVRADRFAIDVRTQISDRVLINGRLGVPVGATAATERAVIGNVEIEFLLNEDGSLRLKIFNREDNLQQIGQQEGYAQGLGLSWSVDFNTMKELYRKVFKKELSTSSK